MKVTAKDHNIHGNNVHIDNKIYYATENGTTKYLTNINCTHF